MSENLKQYLLAKGFKPGKDNSLRLSLFGDYSLSFMPDDIEWQDSFSVSMYLNAKSFSDLMFTLFDQKKTSMAWEYRPRKLRQDKSGCLAMASLGWEEKKPIERSVFSSAGIFWDLRDIDELIQNLHAPDDLFNELFKKRLGHFLIMVEGVWVYLYLCKQSGLNNQAILQQINDKDFSGHSGQWQLAKPMDEHLISYFSDAYDNFFK